MRRIKAALVVLLGLVIAAGMSLAGYWQLQVYQRQGAEAAAARAALPPVALADVAPANARVGDGYGRTVTVTGSYEPAHQLRIPFPDGAEGLRMVSLLRIEDGRALVVVRGVLTGGDTNVPPSGPQSVRGVLLPSEPATAPSGPDGLGSIRIAQLVQRWPGPLVDGFVTVEANDARAQGLEPAPVALPEGRGRLRNGAYALQWWLFAAFTVVMAGRIARDVGRPREAAELDPPLPSRDG
ncbi:MAG TPA: SURF1 family protein [Propionibacteriaceae bacterium]|nr:SURF1 family protein [Propionibacteriaceae bacterium]